MVRLVVWLVVRSIGLMGLLFKLCPALAAALPGNYQRYSQSHQKNKREKKPETIMLSLAVIAVVGLVVGLGYFGLRHFMGLAQEIASLFQRVTALEMVVRDDPHRAWVEQQITQQQIAQQQEQQQQEQQQQQQQQQQQSAKQEKEVETQQVDAETNVPSELPEEIEL